MASSKPPLKALHELSAEDPSLIDCFAVLSEKSRGIARNGKPFYTCRFRDILRTVTAMVWSDSPLFELCEKEWRVGHFYKIRGQYQESEGFGAQLKLDKVRPVEEGDEEEGFDPAQLVESSRFDPAEMMHELRALIEAHINKPLRQLCLTLLQQHAPELLTLPATMFRFHPFRGGLLEHILSVFKNCLFLIDRYRDYYVELDPPLNKDLLLAGAVLHDLGRARELDAEAMGAEQTVQGHLFGHLILGRDMVREAAREQGDIPARLLEQLEHLVLTHLRLPEWGSPRLPLIPECILLHHADDLDAKLEMYVRCLTRDESDGPLTERDPSLNRRLLKDRGDESWLS